MENEQALEELKFIRKELQDIRALLLKNSELVKLTPNIILPFLDGKEV